MIRLSLQCGVGVSQEELESFAHALGPVLTGRLRRLFLSELGDLDLKVMADPADDQVLVMLLGPVEDGLQPEPVTRALERVGLSERLALDPACWQRGRCW